MYLDPSGNIVGTTLIGPTLSRFFRGSGGVLENLVPAGGSSPAGDNELFGVFSQSVNHRGTMTYRARYTGSNPENGIYQLAMDGTVASLVLDGSATPEGGTVDGTSFFTVNESNQVATFASISKDGQMTYSLVLADANSFQEIVSEGDILNDGITTLEEIEKTITNIPMVNDKGDIAFVGDYRQGGSGRGVFLTDDTGTALIAGRNELGAFSATSTIEIFGHNDSQKVAFTIDAGFGLDPTSSLFLAESGNVTLVAMEDTEAPGTDKYFGDISGNSATLNADGDIAFVANLVDVVGGPRSGKALYRYSEEFGLQTIIVTGDCNASSTMRL